jgi:[acyl-carrier-protein] S-malonyltransferase
MGRDLFEADESVRRLYETASEAIGEDIARLSFEGPEETLKQTRFTQPAILLHSLAVLKIMGDRVPAADLTAGHSLGEYGSLVLAGVLSYEDAIRAVVKRAALMEEACRKNPSTMAAVMGLDEEKVRAICDKASAAGVVVPANFNSAIQIVISGDNEAVAEACRLCTEAGAKRAVMLPVGGAFHSPLMASARDGMKEFLETLDFAEPTLNIVPNVTGTAVNEATRLKELLVEQITSPVMWHRTMQYFAQQGITTVIEIGPGKVLTGLAKREIKGGRLINIDKLVNIENFSLEAVN